MQILKVNPDLPDPSPATESSIGLDLYADIEEEILLLPKESCKISTGIKVAIPKGHAGMLFPRSSKGSSGMMLKNTVGIIDPDYRGLVYANITNYENEALRVSPKERFVQLVIVKCHDLQDISFVEELDETERGEGGFGSTGTH